MVKNKKNIKRKKPVKPEPNQNDIDIFCTKKLTNNKEMKNFTIYDSIFKEDEINYLKNLYNQSKKFNKQFK